MRIKKYKLRKGAVIPGLKRDNVQDVGEEIERLTLDNEGNVTPEILVEMARKRKSPLHKCFTWDDSEAARKQRLHEARLLLGAIEAVVIVQKDEPPRILRAFVNVESSVARAGTYMPVIAAMENPSTQADLLTEAYNALQRWAHKYESLKEFAQIVNIIKTMKRPAKRRRKKSG